MAQNQNRALSMLSIAAKAGKVQSGGFLTEKAIQEGVAYFVIIAEDASGNTQKINASITRFRIRLRLTARRSADRSENRSGRYLQ